MQGKQYLKKLAPAAIAVSAGLFGLANAQTSPTNTTTYISDMEWVAATSDFVPVRRDRSMELNPISIGGKRYSKGVTTHPFLGKGAELRVRLDGKYTTFLADIGVDDEVGNRGSVVFKVFADGVQLYSSDKVTGSCTTKSVQVDVTGRRELCLIVTHGSDTNWFDHADWADARLVSGTATVNTMPTVRLASPYNGATYTAPAQITLSAEASDSDGKIAKVEFYSGTTKIGEKTEAPFTYVLKSTPGAHSFTARATDNSGNEVTGAPVAVTVGEPDPSTIVHYISDMPWISATSDFGQTQRDLSNERKPITVAGKRYSKGVGTHPFLGKAAELRVRLDGKYDTFLADIGVDDEVGNKGSVVFQVYADGAQIYSSETLTGESPFKSVEVNVTGRQELRLLVTHAGDTNWFDHADWAGARVVGKVGVAPIEPKPIPPTQGEPTPLPPVVEPPVVEPPVLEPPVLEPPVVIPPTQPEPPIVTPPTEPVPPVVEEPAPPVVVEPVPPVVVDPVPPIVPDPPVGGDPVPPIVPDPPVVEEPAPPVVEEPAPPVVAPPVDTETWTVVDAYGKVVGGAVSGGTQSSNDSYAGDLYVEPSTMRSLGFQWNLVGDADRDGNVEVRYRKTGDSAWKQGESLLRIKGERINKEYTAGNLYAGSIMFLEAGVQYDVVLSLTDPDQSGVVAQRQLRVSTKAQPVMNYDGRMIHVYPSNYSGSRLQPAYSDVASAVNVARPGDHVVVHAGNYTPRQELMRSGTRERPIVVRAAGDGPVVFTNIGTAFNVENADYIWFNGLTFRGYERGIRAVEGHGITVTRCRFENVNVGVETSSPKSREMIVADNDFISTTGSWHRSGSEQTSGMRRAVWVAGQGMDICYNRVENGWDAFSIFDNDPKEVFVEKNAGIDMYNNDVRQIQDDAVELDGGQHNVRVFNNRFVDIYVAVSAQPVWGGPGYIVRNVSYNVTRGLVYKLVMQPAGLRIYHNTSVSFGGINDSQVAGLSMDGWSNIHLLNNVFLGIQGRTIKGGAIDPNVTKLDYNAYRWVDSAQWNFYNPNGTWKGPGSFNSLTDMYNKTGFEKNGVKVNFTDFTNIPQPMGQVVNNPFDFGDATPNAGSPVVDSALRIPGMNDGFTGTAPDRGAIERGVPAPHYGPRN